MRTRVKYRSRLLSLLGVLSLCSTSVNAVTLNSVEFSSLSGDRVEIRMNFDGVPPEPSGYTIEEPARIVLDLPGVVSGLSEKHHELGIGNARRVSVLSAQDRTRAIVNLTELVAYDTEIDGKTLFLMVGARPASQSNLEEVPPSASRQIQSVTSVSGAGRCGDFYISNLNYVDLTK